MCTRYNHEHCLSEMFTLKNRAANLELALEFIAEDRFDGAHRFPIDGDDDDKLLVWFDFMQELGRIIKRMRQLGDYSFHSSFIGEGFQEVSLDEPTATILSIEREENEAKDSTNDLNDSLPLGHTHHLCLV